jgi:hypothetical protein
MSRADTVRERCLKHHMVSARTGGQKTAVIRAGDVHAALGYRNRMPMVCSAIGSNALEQLCRVERTAVEGPLNGANTTFTFRLV